MIALDTNILARFYVDDPGDPEAAKQRPLAYEIVTKVPASSSPSPSSWNWNGCCALFTGSCHAGIRVMEHLLGLPNVNVEEVDGSRPP